ncbi:MAG: hypothetical protein IRZ06_01975 [Nevskia sp.]|nr:hypothetical protein [Nevskia sp.]
MNSINLHDSYATPFIAAVLLSFLFALAAVSVLTFLDTERGQRWQRAWLGRRLAHSRMRGMLAAHGIEPQTYLQQTPVAQMRAQLRVCRECPYRQRCARVCDTARHFRSGRDYSFCPNRPAIERFLRDRAA